MFGSQPDHYFHVGRQKKQDNNCNGKQREDQ